MEVLSTELHKDWIGFLVVGIILTAIGLYMTTDSFIHWKIKEDLEKKFLIGGILVVLVGIGISLFSMQVDDRLEHEVRVEDFNEIYNKGYKVKDRDGDIYIIEKSVDRE